MNGKTVIHIEQPVSASPEELIRRFEAEVLTMPAFQALVDSHRIDGNRLDFASSKGFTGVAVARDGMLVVDVTLTGLSALMKPFIESRLRAILAHVG